MTMAESAEMYLETILILREKNHYVRSVDIAEYMNFSKPSVSRAMHILEDSGHLTMDRNHLITLTPAGEEIAQTMLKRHKLLTRCLTWLGVSQEAAERDACKIEHDICEETFETLVAHAKRIEGAE